MGTKRPLAHPPEPGYPCFVSDLGELAWVAPREGLFSLYDVGVAPQKLSSGHGDAVSPINVRDDDGHRGIGHDTDNHHKRKLLDGELGESEEIGE